MNFFNKISTRTYVTLGVLLAIFVYVFLNRFEFLVGSALIRCSNITGECQIIYPKGSNPFDRGI